LNPFFSISGFSSRCQIYAYFQSELGARFSKNLMTNLRS